MIQIENLKARRESAERELERSGMWHAKRVGVRAGAQRQRATRSVPRREAPVEDSSELSESGWIQWSRGLP